MNRQPASYLTLLVVAFGTVSVTVLVYDSNLRLGPLLWSLYLVPVAFMAYQWGRWVGLGASLCAFVLLFPFLVPALLGSGVTLSTVPQLAMGILLFSLPIAVDTVSSLQRQETALSGALTQRAGELQLLLNTSEIVSSSLDLDEVLRRLAEMLVASLQLTLCNVFLLEEDEVSMVRVGARDSARHPEATAANDRFPLGEAPGLRRVVETRTPLLARQDVPEIALSSEELMLLADDHTRTALLVPIVARERTLGVITVGEHRQWERSPIDPEKVSLCQAMASQAAVAIENAQLFRTVAREGHRLQRILEGMADGVFTTDADRRIVSFNPAAESLTGWEIEEVLGRFCCDVLSPQRNGKEDACPTDCALARAMERGELVKTGAMPCRVSGRRSGHLQLSASVAPLVGGTGETSGAVVVFRDVTREAELDRIKSDFVSMISHEIRSPATNISCAAQMLRSGNGPHAEELVELIQKESTRLGNLVEQVLNASSLERGTLDLRLEASPIVPLLRDAIDTVQATTRRHRMTLRADGELPLALMDRPKIEVVVMNLLRNAVNYSPDGGEVRTAVRHEGGEVVVTVEDEGMGIPVEQQDRIFDRFTRVDTSDAKTVYGHGLGLYIARGMVERHGGRIWVRSQPGGGACFSFTLPAVSVQTEDDD